MANHLLIESTRVTMDTWVHQQFPKTKKKQELFPNFPQFIDITTIL